MRRAQSRRRRHLQTYSQKKENTAAKLTQTIRQGIAFDEVDRIRSMGGESITRVGKERSMPPRAERRQTFVSISTRGAQRRSISSKGVWYVKKLILVVALLPVGCGIECDEDEMRCDGDVVMVCEGRTWERLEDCGSQGLRCNVGGFCGSGACCQL